ncbi:MAG TPA: hypothetical protein VJH90_00810 [archaeon]|nr:hypothetical protein [archaeon]
MAEWMVFIKKENASKAEDALRRDFDVAARQSITIRDASVLGIKTDSSGSIFYITGTDEGVKRCQELIKGYVEKIDDSALKSAKEKMIKESESAASGMGALFG